MKWLRRYWSRAAAGTAISVVAAVTGVVSYMHIYALTVALHGSVMVARLMPFGVDGLIVVGSVVLLQSAPGQSWLGYVGLVPGVATSLFANVESGVHHGALAAVWAGVPAGAFALATFQLERWLKAQAGQGGRGGRACPECAARAASADTDSDQCLHGVASTADEAVVLAFLHGRDCLGKEPSQRHLSASFGVPRPKVAQLVGSLNGHNPPGGNP